MNEKISNALNEARILVLGVQVLAGFEYEAAFESKFSGLPRQAQWMTLGSLWLMVVAFILLMAPAAYHRIVEKGGESHRFHVFITRVTAPALLPFAAGMAANFYVAMLRANGRPGAATAAIAMLVAALFFWYGWEVVVRIRTRAEGSERAMDKQKEVEEEEKPTPLAERITMVMTETRVVLPGAQALLGFQFVVTLMQQFDSLPGFLKTAHLVSLGLVGLATIFLMAPAAYHRIVEGGQDTERVHTFASRMVLLAMAVLAPGVCVDLLVVAAKVLGSIPSAAAIAGATLAMFYAFWFGYMLVVRARVSGHAAQPRIERARAA